MPRETRAHLWDIDQAASAIQRFIDGVDVQTVPGNHATMIYKPNVETLAAKLAACIEQVQPDLEYLSKRIEPSGELIKGAK